MKTWILGVALIVCTILQVAAQGDRYFYRGEPMPLSLNTQHAYLLMEPGQDLASTRKLLMPNTEVKRWGTQASSLTGLDTKAQGVDQLAKGRIWVQVQFPVALSERQYTEMLEQLEARTEVALASPYFSDSQTGVIGLSEFFSVRVTSPIELQTLKALAKATNTSIVGPNKFMSRWYTLACDDKSQGNALEMANHFLQAGRFSESQPDLMTDDAPFCVNDALFGTQWGLQNTGQYGGTPGVDINACDAWANWTTGDPSVIIAILDQGYEENHPDLINNHSGLSWDSEAGTSPAAITGSHGTACAGIAAAQGNNNIGVAGVARTCELMNIGNSLASTPLSRQRRADGINWAWQNGAAVVSNSWGSSVAYAVIDDAIQDALDFGRGGLGTLICFASGNNNGAVSYPANANPGILVVGAMSPCGERKNPASCDGENWWGGNFGPTLDIVAPGVLISTTDRQGANGYDPTDYTTSFNGTSSACPHVAGLVGLIISMNPCLTWTQVSNIIERTAQKVGGYAYAVTGGRPNGTWHNEMGYGLIDADAALRYTRELYLQNVTFTGYQLYQVFGTIAAGSNVTPTLPVGPVTVAAGGNLNLHASVSITLAPGFSTVLGGALSAIIITDANCSDWDLTAARIAPTVAMTPEEAEAVETQQAIAKLSDWDLAVFPNPSKGAAKVAFKLPKETKVTVEIYDAGMNRILEVVSPQAFAAGLHEVDLDASNIPAGIYFLRMSTETQHMIRKLSIMR